MTEDVQLERVSMQWPKDLKEKVREKVGSRGLTEFTVEAVNLHLQGGAEVSKNAAVEVNELKWLVQNLADRVAMSGDLQARKEALMEIDLPDWIETSGWSPEFAELVRPQLLDCSKHPGNYIPAGSTECPHCRMERKAQEAEKEEGPAPVAPEPVDLPHDAGSGYLARVMEKAREKGVELADIGLKPASEIPQPKSPTDQEAEEAIAIMEEVVAIAENPNEVEAEQLRAEAASAEGRCASCGEELVDGECWTCG